jgi:hypothetical protein
MLARGIAGFRYYLSRFDFRTGSEVGEDQLTRDQLHVFGFASSIVSWL